MRRGDEETGMSGIWEWLSSDLGFATTTMTMLTPISDTVSDGTARLFDKTSDTIVWLSFGVGHDVNSLLIGEMVSHGRYQRLQR